MRFRPDVSKENEAEVLFERSKLEHGKLDILVNNVAFDGGPIEKIGLEAWNNVVGSCMTVLF